MALLKGGEQHECRRKALGGERAQEKGRRTLTGKEQREPLDSGVVLRGALHLQQLWCGCS